MTRFETLVQNTGPIYRFLELGDYFLSLESINYKSDKQ